MVLGFNPIKNIFRSEIFFVKRQKILKPQFFSVKQKYFLYRFFGAASCGRFLIGTQHEKFVQKTEIFSVDRIEPRLCPITEQLVNRTIVGDLKSDFGI